MKLFIAKQERPVTVRVHVRLNETVVQTLERYCAFKESDRDYVIGAVLEKLFQKDREFVAWCETTETTDRAPVERNRA